MEKHFGSFTIMQQVSITFHGCPILGNRRVNGIAKHHVDVVKALYQPIYDALARAEARPINAVAAIKFMRAEYRLGLKEAKDLCEFLVNPQNGEIVQSLLIEQEI